VSKLQKWENKIANYSISRSVLLYFNSMIKIILITGEIRKLYSLSLDEFLIKTLFEYGVNFLKENNHFLKK
jgi:hypothetical protein